MVIPLKLRKQLPMSGQVTQPPALPWRFQALQAAQERLVSWKIPSINGGYPHEKTSMGMFALQQFGLQDIAGDKWGFNWS